MDGGLTAAVLLSPPDHLRTGEILSKRWGPPQGGVSLKELIQATSWQAHSVRGFLSAAIGKKMRLTVASTKAENGDRTYSVKA
jgi:hypothetical protein